MGRNEEVEEIKLPLRKVKSTLERKEKRSFICIFREEEANTAASIEFSEIGFSSWKEMKTKEEVFSAGNIV